MSELKSRYVSFLTVEYMTKERENIVFDRKSAMSKPASLADDISAFANAEGGSIVIGISNNGEIEGVNSLDNERLNDLIESPKSTCRPMPLYDYELLPVINKSGQEDRLLLLHIKSANRHIVRTAKDDTYLRMGDRSVLMKGENLRQLEYQKQLLRYEDEICPRASIDDLDEKLIHDYKICIDAEDITTEQVLTARGMMKEGMLTYAAVLLFAKNIRQFYPNCRVRFIRYEGCSALQGTSLNIIKDQMFERPILHLIDEVKKFVGNSLRDFTTLSPTTGQFETTPEYPEFAWLEGIVNAITHREYAYSGDYIRIIMYDDRLVIESPGKLPYPVTTKNIRYTRSSRNPTIARVLTELGWVRELNEGVKRIFADMAELYLNPPTYKEAEAGSLKLTLRNNIHVRHARFKDNALRTVGIESWEKLDDLEKSIVIYMSHITKVKTADLSAHTNYSTKTIQNRLNHLIELGIVNSFGRPTDPQRYYTLTAYQQ
ncbi:MAG: putative DNA binding domain-containing protein [Akkermansia sp.]|nr:putative DNA binding domain-containing protein [Akkermansia sp.]